MKEMVLLRLLFLQNILTCAIKLYSSLNIMLLIKEIVLGHVSVSSYGNLSGKPFLEDFLFFAPHGRVLTGVSPEYAKVVGNV